MARWSWIPGLPSLGPTYDLWAVDPADGEVPLSQCALLFLSVDGGDEAYPLANRTGSTKELSDVVFVRRDHEKESTKIGGQRLLIKRWQLMSADDVAEPDGKAIRRPPDGAQGPLPPKEFTDTDASSLADALP